MGFGLITAGLILLFNPVIHVVDIIPDAIGFFLIAAGLTKISYIVEKCRIAREWFLRLAILDTVKFFAIILVPYTSGSSLVLMAMFFGLCEGFMFVNAVVNLFEGISFAGLWYNGTAMYGEVKVNKWVRTVGKDGRKSQFKRREVFVERIGRIKNSIIAFYIFRCAATFIPEMTELEMYDYVGEVKAIQFRLTYYKPFLYVVFSAAVIIAGIVYIRRVTKYFGGISKDERFISSITEMYEREILPKENFFISIRMKRVLILFAASVVFSLIVPVDGVDICIGAVSAVLLICAAVNLKEYRRAAAAVTALSAVRAVLSIVNFVIQYSYFIEYSVEAVDWIDKAHDMYYTMSACAAAEYIISLAASLIFAAVLLKVIKKHLQVFGIQSSSAQFSKLSHDAEVYNACGGKVLLTAILAILHCAFACAYRYLLPTMDVIGVITTVVTLIYAAYAVHTINFINGMIYEKEIEMN